LLSFCWKNLNKSVHVEWTSKCVFSYEQSLSPAAFIFNQLFKSVTEHIQWSEIFSKTSGINSPDHDHLSLSYVILYLPNNEYSILRSPRLGGTCSWIVRKLRNSIVADNHLNVDVTILVKYIKHWLIMINRTLTIFACIACFALSSKRIYLRLLINQISRFYSYTIQSRCRQ
jgi:hypothetical protein